MLWESFHSRGSRSEVTDITKCFLLLTLSVATSIDALVGSYSDWFSSGEESSGLVEKRAEAIGGIALIVVGIRVLLSHIL